VKIVDLPTLLDRLFNALMGSFVTLLLLSQFGRGDFSREAGFVLFAAIPLAAFDIWQRRRKMSDETPLSVHLVISALAFLTFSGMFIAKHSFGVEAVGYWTFLPLIVFFWANWSADREAEAAHG
jgi:hypothetical protein